MFDVCHMFVLKYYLRPILIHFNLYNSLLYNSITLVRFIVMFVLCKHVRLTCVFNKLMMIIVVKNVFYVFYFSIKNMFLMFFILCMFFFIFKNIYNILTWPMTCLFVNLFFIR